MKFGMHADSVPLCLRIFLLLLSIYLSVHLSRLLSSKFLPARPNHSVHFAGEVTSLYLRREGVTEQNRGLHLFRMPCLGHFHQSVASGGRRIVGGKYLECQS